MEAFGISVLPTSDDHYETVRWDSLCVSAWSLFQTALQAQLCDGCVDQETLKKAVEEEGSKFLHLRQRVMATVEALREEGEYNISHNIPR